MTKLYATYDLLLVTFCVTQRKSGGETWTACTDLPNWHFFNRAWRLNEIRLVPLLCVIPKRLWREHHSAYVGANWD